MASRKATEILTPRNRFLLEKLTGHKLVKKFPRLLRNPKVHYSIHKGRHLSMSWTRSVLSISPHPTSLKSLLKLTFNLGLCFPRVFIRSPHHNSACISSVSHARYIPRPSHSSLFDHSNNIWGGIQTTKPIVMLSFPLPFYLVTLRSKYLHQHTILDHPQPTFLLASERPRFTSTQKTGQNGNTHGDLNRCLYNFRKEGD